MSEKILVIDDDPNFSRLMETILRGEGYDVEVAATVREALTRGSRAQYHLIISDLHSCTARHAAAARPSPGTF